MNDAEYEQLYIRGFNLGFTAGRLEPEFYKETIYRATKQGMTDDPYCQGMKAGNQAQLRDAELIKLKAMQANNNKQRPRIR